MERSVDYDLHEFRQKKKGDPEENKTGKSGIGSIFLMQLIVCLITAILLLFTNILFPDAIKNVKVFYETQIKRDKGITPDISNAFRDVLGFLTSSSNSSEAPESSGLNSDSSSVSTTGKSGTESTNLSGSSVSMGAGGEETPIIMPCESAGLVVPDITPIQTDYVIPVHGKISSDYGYRLHPITGMPDFHKGIDVPAEEGTEIAAFQKGIVIQAQHSESFGNFVAVEHENGIVTRYGHCSKLNVKVGDAVEAGDTVGFVGSTGYSTGNHCHFDLSVNGVFIDPLKVIPSYQKSGYVTV